MRKLPATTAGSIRAVAMLLVTLGGLPHGKALAAEPSRIGGTFIQLAAAHGEWRPEDWTDLFGQFRQLGVTEIVVQWTLYDETAFFATDRHKTVAHPPLENILRLADENRMKVLIGLAHDPAFWDRIRRDPVLVEIYLRRLRLRSESVAAEIAPMVRAHPSFQGWYVPEEVDDGSWRAPERRRLLFSHLRDLAASLRASAPGCEIAISGFSNAQTDPRAFEEFWSALLGSADVDRLLFQDGVGAAKLGLVHAELYLDAIRKAAASSSRRLQIVVEIFQQVAGPPVDATGPFRAVPAPLNRIVRQLDLASRYSSLPVMAFSVPDYMSPRGGEDADRLYRAYLSR